MQATHSRSLESKKIELAVEPLTFGFATFTWSPNRFWVNLARLIVRPGQINGEQLVYPVVRF